MGLVGLVLPRNAAARYDKRVPLGDKWVVSGLDLPPLIHISSVSTTIDSPYK
jgi:hypothetical protein